MPYNESLLEMPARDIKEYIKALPTKEDIRALPTKDDILKLINVVEANFKEAMELLKIETVALGNRVETLETGHEEVVCSIKALQAHIHQQDNRIELLTLQLDDHENRERRQNIRIRGLPESITTTDLEKVLQRIFTQILGERRPETIDIDRAHRALLPPPKDINLRM